MKPMQGHILMCGFSESARAALAELEDELRTSGATLLSQNEVPEIEGVKHLRLDYLNTDHLRDRRVGLSSCSVCVVFAEYDGPGNHIRSIDMRTVLAVYNIKNERPDLPVIAEILDRENTTFIDELGCDDVIYKETIDSNVITSCVLHPHISPIFYDLLTAQGKSLLSVEAGSLNLASPATYRDVRLRGLEDDVTYLGYIDRSGTVKLMPPNDTVIEPHFHLVYVE